MRFHLLIGSTRGLAQVRGDKELSEQQEVRHVNGHPGVQGGEGYVTGAARRFGVVRVEGDERAHHHLSDLRDGDAHGQLTGNAHAESTQCIVAVHDGVHQEVHVRVPAANGSLIGIAVPRENENGSMVVPVEEDELLATQHHEHRVNQFGRLGQNEQPSPEAGSGHLRDQSGCKEKSPFSNRSRTHLTMKGVGTHGMMESIVGQHMHHLGPHSQRAANGEGGQDNVPQGQRKFQSEWFVACGHVEFAEEDEGQVGGGIVERRLPILAHPPTRLAVIEFILKLEHISVVGREGIRFGSDQFQFVHDR